MKHVSATNAAKIILLLGLTCIVGAWQPHTGKKQLSTSQNTYGDTGKPRVHGDEINIDLSNLDVQMKQLDVQLKNLNLQLEKIDFPKIEMQIKAALDTINFKKINDEVQHEINKINWKEINEEVNASVKEAQENVAKINMEQVKQSMEVAKHALENARLEMKINSKQWQEQLQRSLKDTHKYMERAKDQLKAYKQLKYALAKDGLIDTTKKYSIQLNEGDLIINGVKQPKAVTDKYRRYLPADINNFMEKNDSEDNEKEGGEDL